MQQLRQIIPALMIGVLAGGIGTFQSLQSSSYGNGGNPAFTTQSVSAPTQDVPGEIVQDTTETDFVAGTDPDGNPYESEITEATVQPDGTLVYSRSDSDTTSALAGKGGEVVDGDTVAEAIGYSRYTCGPTANDTLEITEVWGKNNEFKQPIIAKPTGFEMLLGTKVTTHCKDQLWDNELQKMVPTKDTPYGYYGYGIRSGKFKGWKPGQSIFSFTPVQASEGTCSFQRREKKRWGETKRVAHLQCGPNITLTPVACNVTLTEDQGTFTHEATFTNAEDRTTSICTLKKKRSVGILETIKSHEAQGKKNTGTSTDGNISKGFGTAYRVECTVNNVNTCSSNSISL